MQHPRASLHRQRAAELRHTASQIEVTVISRLEQLMDDAGDALLDSPRGRLCLAMLARHLDQLHASVDDLREMAHRWAIDADHLDHTSRSLVG